MTMTKNLDLMIQIETFITHTAVTSVDREWAESSKKTYTVLEHFGLRIHLAYMGYIY